MKILKYVIELCKKRFCCSRLVILISIFIFSCSKNSNDSVPLVYIEPVFELNYLSNQKEKTASIGIGDIDDDGDIDILEANGRHWPAQNRVFLNNGKGIFTVAIPLGLEKDPSYSTELADFDNDGDLDVAVGNDRTPNFIFINDGAGNFVKASSFGRDDAPTRNIIVADIDND